MKKKNYDLTQGNILRSLLWVALPIMGTSLMQMTYNLTDMFWLGRLQDSGASVAASGTAGMFLWLSMAFISFGRMGAEIGVSQSLGAGKHDEGRKFAGAALWISVCIGLLYSSLLVFIPETLIGFFGIQEAGVAADAANYLRIVGLACPFTFITGALTGTFNGSGNTMISFIANALGLVINMILDPIMIFGMNMGIHGAAIATGIAQLTVCAVLIIAIKVSARPFESFAFFKKPDAAKVKQVFKWCLPIAIENMLFTSLSMIITRFVAEFGQEQLTVQRIGSQIESLSWLIGGSFGSAVTTFVGQNFGAKQVDRIKKGYKVSAYAMIVWGVCVTALLFFLGEAFFGVFIQDSPAIVGFGGSYMKILATCQIIACLEGISAGAFRGTGKTIPPSLVSAISNAIRVPLAYILSQTSLGVNGIWVGVTAGAFLRGLWMFVWFMVYSRTKMGKNILAEQKAV